MTSFSADGRSRFKQTGDLPQGRSNEDLLDALKAQFSREEWEIWLSPLSLVQGADGSWMVGTDGIFKKKKLEEQYATKIKAFLQHEFPTQVIKLDVRVEAALKSSTQSSSQTQESVSALPALESEPARQQVRGGLSVAGLHHAFTFDRYVLHEENRLAFACAKKVCEKIGAHNPLYIFGSSGTGKTHLIQAIGNYYQEHFPFLKIRYLNPLDFLSEYRHALNTRSDRAFRLKYRALDVLLIDDIQFFAGKEQTTEEFFHLFNEIYVPGKQMVFTSDVAPAALDKIDERLKSRLGSGLIVEMESPREAARRYLLDFYLEEQETDFSSEVRDLLVSALPADVRRIMSAVKTLAAAHSIYQEPVTASFVKKVLGGLLSEQAGVGFSPEKLMQAVVAYSKISLDDFRSTKRSQHISFYRQLAMYLLRKHAQWTLAEIASYFGGKSPASVTQAIQSVEARLKNDPLLGQLAEKFASV